MRIMLSIMKQNIGSVFLSFINFMNIEDFPDFIGFLLIIY